MEYIPTVGWIKIKEERMKKQSVQKNVSKNNVRQALKNTQEMTMYPTFDSIVYFHSTKQTLSILINIPNGIPEWISDGIKYYHQKGETDDQKLMANNISVHHILVNPVHTIDK